MSQIVTIEDLAKLFLKLLRSDRDINVGISGSTGEGKSTFAIQLLKEYNKLQKKQWDYRYTTWSREELVKWIDGEGETKKDQAPEFTAILVDELVSLFYKRNWFEDDQKESVELFNKCRDRHLLIVGNIPVFWDLDSGFMTRVRYWVYIPERRRAWVFEQDNNPFGTDVWNRRENHKIFNKYKHPYRCKNFLFEVHFSDLSDSEKTRYLQVRNTKRVGTEGQSSKKIRYKKVKVQRDKLITWMFDNIPKMSTKKIAEITGVSRRLAQKITAGVLESEKD